jgi:hypothetical protein
MASSFRGNDVVLVIKSWEIMKTFGTGFDGLSVPTLVAFRKVQGRDARVRRAL